MLVAKLYVPAPILGVYALERLGFKSNSITGKLEVVGPRQDIYFGSDKRFHLSVTKVA